MKYSNREYVPIGFAPFQETTANIPGMHPFVAEAGIVAPGHPGRAEPVVVGFLRYDTFHLYRRGMLLNPNGLVQGTVGSGKSSSVKTTIKRETTLQHQICGLMRPKGEYTRLARWMGYEPVFLGPGLRTRLNPAGRATAAGRSDRRPDGHTDAARAADGHAGVRARLTAGLGG